MTDGRTIINKYFDSLLVLVGVCHCGEDVGKIGDVNQGFAGLQDKYGKLRTGTSAFVKRQYRSGNWSCYAWVTA
jgi:hypothetical protein